jgi:hypothetical protein
LGLGGQKSLWNSAARFANLDSPPDMGGLLGNSKLKRPSRPAPKISVGPVCLAMRADAAELCRLEQVIVTPKTGPNLNPGKV